MADDKDAGKPGTDDAKGVEIIKKAGKDVWEKTHGGKAGNGK